MHEQRDLQLRRGGRLSISIATVALTAILAVAALGALGKLPIPVHPMEAPAPIASVSVVSVPSVSAVALHETAVRLSTVTIRLARNQTLGQALSRLQLAPKQVQAILTALADKFPFHRSKPGDQIQIERVAEDQSLHRFTYRQSAADEWTVVPTGDGSFKGEKRQIPVSTELVRVDVEIQTSVWESLQKAGEDPTLAVLAADVLAWDVDFYQDVRPGDRMKVLVEKIHADGTLLRYGDIIAAEYDGGVTGRKRLFRYTDPTGQVSYFDDEGNSARRGFLKSPLKYAHVTSRFGNRVHPILGYARAHKGIDYGAPTGTPVWAVGDGTIAHSGWRNGYGKSVVIRHRNGYETEYCHLSSISVRAGTHVSQKQLIGAVGSTGLSTGPHLHYGVKRGGAHMNPLHLKLPREAPIAPSHRADFQQKIAPIRARLDAAPVA